MAVFASYDSDKLYAAQFRRMGIQFIGSSDKVFRPKDTVPMAELEILKFLSRAGVP